MDIFHLRDRVIDEYSQYTQSFLTILDPDIQSFVTTKLQSGSLWPDALIQLSPSYQQGGTVEDLVQAQKIHALCGQIFRKRDRQHNLRSLRLYSHQIKALELAQEILTGGDSSRLYQKLVYEMQLAQSVKFVADLREDVGLLLFQVILASGKSVAETQLLLFAEIEKLAAEPVGAAELTKAKNRLLTARLHDRETSEGKATALAEAAVILGDAGRVNGELEKLQALTAADIQRVARAVFTKQNRLVLEWLPEVMKGAKK